MFQLLLAASILLVVTQVHADYAEPQYNAQPYSFGYDTKDSYGTRLTRQENGDGYGTVKGSYGYSDNAGLYRTVEYTADKGGYRARIKTNEPGIEKSNPADAVIDGPSPAWAKDTGKSGPSYSGPSY